MCIGPKSDCFMTTPQWYHNGSIMTVEPNLEILGVLLQSDMISQLHVNDRVNKCRRSLYSLIQVVMSHPGLNSSSKCHLYKTVCRPSLLYGMEAIRLHNNVKKLESYQGSVIKHICGLSKRSHHRIVKQALGATSHHNISHHNISHHNISHHNISHHNISHHNISHHNISHHNISHHNISHHNISHHNISHHDISHHNISHHNISYHNISHHNISHHNIGERRSPAVACWASDHWVASPNPLGGKFRH